MLIIDQLGTVSLTSSTSANLDVQESSVIMDVSTGITSIIANVYTITSATTTTVVTAPGSGFQKQLKLLIITNTHATTSNIIVLKYVSGSSYILTPFITLAAGESIFYIGDSYQHYNNIGVNITTGLATSGITSITFTSPLQTTTGGTISTTGTVSIPVATTSVNGYLSSTDWNTFNGKQAVLSGTGIVKSTSGTISYISGTSVQFIKGDGSLDSTTYLSTISGTTNRISVSGSTIDISTAYIGQTSLTTLGTITTGVWNGSKLSEIYGGTNQSTYTTGDILYASASNTLSKLGVGSNGQVLTLASGIPSWATPTTGTVTSVSGTTNRIISTGGTTPVIDISATFEALLGKVASPLSQFAATTSAQLAGVISDETGSGALVFATSPTLITPILGTPISGVATNLTGLPLTTGVTGILPIANGGTNKSSVTISPLPSSWAGWDANSNFSANTIIPGYQTIATAAGTTTLTVSSPYQNYFTGSTTQIVVLPVATTLVNGDSRQVVNLSSGTVTVNSSGGNLVQTLISGSKCIFTRIGTATDATAWNTTFSATSGGVLSTSNSDGTLTISPTTGAVVASLALGHANTWTGVQTLTDSIVTVSTPVVKSTGYLGIPINTQNTNYTTVLTDSGKKLYHDDSSAYTWTIAANSSVPSPIDTAITFINNASAAVNITIAITTDTLIWVGTGATGSRTLARYGWATATKVAATIWMISGINLT